MAKELELKYGCNPNQKPARIFMQEGELPIEVLNGRPGYINFMRLPECRLRLHSNMLALQVQLLVWIWMRQ